MKKSIVLKGILSLILLIGLIAVLIGGPTYVITNSVRSLTTNQPLEEVGISALFASWTFLSGSFIIIGYCKTKAYDNNRKYPKDTKIILFGELITLAIVLAIAIIALIKEFAVPMLIPYANITLAVISLINFIGSIVLLIRYIRTGK